MWFSRVIVNCDALFAPRRTRRPIVRWQRVSWDMARLTLTRRALLAAAVGSATRVNEMQPQQRGAPVALAGAQLAWRQDQHVQLWDLKTRRMVTCLPAPEPDLALGVMGDSILLAACDLPRSRARLVRIESFVATDIGVQPYYFAGADRVFAAAPGEFWVTEPPRGLARYRLGQTVQRIDAIEWLQAQWLAVTAAAERGCLLFYEGGHIVRLHASGATESFAVTRAAANPQHLATGPRPGTVWATTPAELLLLSLQSNQARIICRYRPGQPVYHMVSAGEFAALLTVTLQAGRWVQTTLIAVDDAGRARWRRELPVPRHEEAWVAGAIEHVAVCSAGRLAVFAARDGGPLTIQTPPGSIGCHRAPGTASP
jgi:hypothetical protein